MAKLDQILVKGTTYEIVPEVAPLFNTSTAYAVGDYVIKDAVLYRFKATHTSGAWSASQVDEVTAGSELKSIKNDKLDKNQGTANVGKYLKVGADGNLENVDLIDDTLLIEGEAADAKAVGDEITNLKSDLSDVDNALTVAEKTDNFVDYVLGNDSTTKGSSNFPALTRLGNIIKLNGSYGSSNARYFYKISGATNKGASQSGAVAWQKDQILKNGNTYSIKFGLLSGSIAKQDTDVFEIYMVDDSSVIKHKIKLNTETTITWDSADTLFLLCASKDIVCTNAVLFFTVVDVTSLRNIEKNIECIEKNIECTQLSQYQWANGKHVTRNENVADITRATDTITLLAAIPYDYNTYFTLADGWKISFVSCEEDVVTGLGREYIVSNDKITMLDIYNNLACTSVSYFGDSLSINIRKSDNTNIDIANLNIDDIIKMYKLHTLNSIDTCTWVAIGDSITDGRFSQTDGSTVRTKTNHYSQYGYIASKINGIDNYVEHGYGGMGYATPATDGTTLADVLALDFGSPNVISVNLGTNDTSKTLGDENSESNDGTISGAIKNCCEVLGTKYPNAHIFFMTPINKCTIGSASTGWAKNAGTTHLLDIASMIKYWANKFGFPVVDMLNESPVNDFNIKTMLLDNLHPTMEAHYMLGKYLAGALPYKII